jgi:hypothetical protein
MVGSGVAVDVATGDGTAVAVGCALSQAAMKKKIRNDKHRKVFSAIIRDIGSAAFLSSLETRRLENKMPTGALHQWASSSQRMSDEHGHCLRGIYFICG